jgi:hypothetical protein
MSTNIDASVYPDKPPPQELSSLAQKADYLHRIVSAFDFGLPPDAATLRLCSTWQEVFDAFPLPSSPGYHALRSYFGWPAIEKAPFPAEPAYWKLDALEDREDGFADCV